MRVATDGSCLKNPGGKTGWAWVAEDGRWQSGSLPEGSNNIGELMAAIAALHAHRKVEKLHLEIDSQYVLNIAQKWGKAWRRKGWKKADGSPVANIKLVSRLLDLVDRPGLTMEWVRGHNGHWLNELTDERAGSAARLQTPTTKGRFTPDEIAEAVLADGDAKAAAAKKRAAKKGTEKPKSKTPAKRATKPKK